MTRDNCKKYIVLTYQEFYRQVTLNSDFKFEFDKLGRKEKVIDGYIDFIDNKYNLKSIGLEFIVNYFESGFNLWYDRKDLKYGVNSIQIEWIIGKKAIERYEKIRDKDNKYFRKFRQIRKDISLNILGKLKLQIQVDSGAIKTILDTVNEFEEKEKERYFNTEEGLMWCQSNTTMYNSNSKLCTSCSYRLRCKDMLRENMPNLYKRRGYEKI